MREWLTVIIACLIIGVLLDGIRRMRAAKRGDMKMSLSMHKGTQKGDLAAYGSELPNGGARVARREAMASKASAPAVSKVASKMMPKVAPKVSEKAVAAKPQKAKVIAPKTKQVELDLDQHVPLLMNVDDDLVASPMEDFADDGGRREPSFVADEPFDSAPEVDAEDVDTDEHDDYDKVLFSGRSDVTKPAAAEFKPQQAAVIVPESELTIEDDDEDEVSSETLSAYNNDFDDEFEEEAAPEEVFVVNVMAPKGEVFVGEAIKDAILGAGMRFGSRKIFHKHEDYDGEGAIQFSLVNMVQPGVFDLAKMAQVETPGLSLFMTLPSDAESLPAYEAMVKAARFIAEDLGGELRDEQHSTLTPQTIEHNRARVSEYERKLQLERARR